MKNLYILGAGGFGREVYSWLTKDSRTGREWAIKGFLSDNPADLDSYDYPIGVVASLNDFRPAHADLVICAIGTPDAKKKCVEPLHERGVEFLSYVSEQALIGENVQIGNGCVICPHVVITCDVQLEDFVTMNVAAGTGHDTRIGKWSTISGHANISGGSQIGESVFIGPHTAILPGARVGNGAHIGTGSVVLKKVKEGGRVFGNPATQI